LKSCRTCAAAVVVAIIVSNAKLVDLFLFEESLVDGDLESRASRSKGDDGEAK